MSSQGGGRKEGGDPRDGATRVLDLEQGAWGFPQGVVLALPGATSRPGSVKGCTRAENHECGFPPACQKESAQDADRTPQGRKEF